MIRLPRIVIIGGGTGSFEILSGLKNYTPNITALVSMADDGGSTGLLRDEYGVLPPGDVRKCLVALSRAPKMRDLFNYRYEGGSFAGHTFGNLFLSTVEKMAGNNFIGAIELASRMLNIVGRVVPVTLDNVTLVIEEENGRVVRGERNLDDDIHFKAQRPKIRLEPAAHITQEGREAILSADIVAIAPGSLYGSLAAVLVVDGVVEALKATKAQKVFICNLVTEHGQTDCFKVHDYAAEIERFLGGQVKLDYVLYNTHKPQKELLSRYYADEQRTWIEYNTDALAKQHYTAIGDNFISEESGHPTTLIRHDADKTALTLQKIYEQTMLE
ncbi:MAG TPA: gluconeogenesis factor YvcK family protein [Candidatus Saccharimonadales bacterium]